MSSTTCAIVTVLQWKNSVSWLIGSGWYSGRQSFRFLWWFVQIRWRCKGWGGGLLIFFTSVLILVWSFDATSVLPSKNANLCVGFSNPYVKSAPHTHVWLDWVFVMQLYATHYGLISTSHYGYGYWRANFPSLVYVLIVPLLILNFCWLLQVHWGASVALSIHHHNFKYLRSEKLEINQAIETK